MADSGGSHSLRSAGKDVCLSPCLLDQSPRLQKYADPNFFPSRRILAREGGTLLRLSTMKRRKKSRETRFSSELAAAADRLREEGRATLVLGMDDFAAL